MVEQFPSWLQGLGKEIGSMNTKDDKLHSNNIVKI